MSQRFAITAVLLCLLVLGSGCSMQRTSAPPLSLIAAPALLVDAQTFPSDWQVQSCEPYCARSERDNDALRGFGRIDIAGQALQHVFRFPSVEAAHRTFQTYQAADFQPLAPPNKTFVPSPFMTYRSSMADEFASGGGVNKVPACYVVLRYQNYVMEWYFDIDGGAGDGLQYTDIEPILRHLDQHVVDVLKLLIGTPQRP